jgi:sRNA-binding protein
MAYPYNRQEIESVIENLAELYPKCFFTAPEHRKPLKHNITVDLVKEGVQMSQELVRSTIAWYESYFAYQFALSAGSPRIDLHGNKAGVVTEKEQRDALKYVHDRRLEERERKQEIEKRRHENVIVEKVPFVSTPPIAKPPTMAQNMPMPKAVKPTNTPLAPIQALLDATRAVYASQPESLRRHFVVAGLRALISETEKVIAALEVTD